MAECGDGFVGRMDIVDPRRGYRQWSTDMKARIVAESLQVGVRVVDVARRYDVAATRISDWRKQARDGQLPLPAELIPTMSPSPDAETFEPAFVPLSIAGEPQVPAVASDVPETVKATAGVVTIEVGSELVVKVPGEVSVVRIAALVRAIRGLA